MTKPSLALREAWNTKTCLSFIGEYCISAGLDGYVPTRDSRPYLKKSDSKHERHHRTSQPLRYHLHRHGRLSLTSVLNGDFEPRSIA